MRRQWPYDDRTYRGMIKYHHWEWHDLAAIWWLWETHFEVKPHLISCDDCIKGYDERQLEILANADLG